MSELLTASKIVQHYAKQDPPKWKSRKYIAMYAKRLGLVQGPPFRGAPQYNADYSMFDGEEWETWLAAAKKRVKSHASRYGAPKRRRRVAKPKSVDTGQGLDIDKIHKQNVRAAPIPTAIFDLATIAAQSAENNRLLKLLCQAWGIQV